MWLIRRLRGWFFVARNGGLARAEVVDEEESLFGAEDVSPATKKRDRESLRDFLMNGQDEWRKDGGVVVPPRERDERLEKLWPFIWASRKRRPKEVVSPDMDVRQYICTFWDVSDFDGADEEVVATLKETAVEEAARVAEFKETGTFAGDKVNVDGCRKLGVSEEKISELSEGVTFEFDRELPAYSKTPYSTVYQTMAIAMMASDECLRLLKLGKLLPLLLLPWIENRITAVLKMIPGGIKWRTCVDLTASGVNGAVRGVKFRLPTIESLIAEMGRRYYVVKQDIMDMFLNFKIHPSRWVLFGFQHPFTGQSYVYPVLPFGFSLSPPIACANTQMAADIIRKEMRARALGDAGLDVLKTVPRVGVVDDKAKGPLPASSVYVDYFVGSARDLTWTEELMQVSAEVFRLLGLPEKISKREGPLTLMTLLGFLFCTVSGILQIPWEKASDMITRIDSLLTRAKNKQSVSWSELARVGGKLTWACTGVELGRMYLRNLRKPLMAVQCLLKNRAVKDSFCIPLWHFGKVIAELEWWKTALECSGGRFAWFLNESGAYAKWVWEDVRGGLLPVGVVEWATDASKWGGGGAYDSDRVVREWNRDEAKYHINVLECLMILHMCLVFGPRLSGLRVVAWCDNMVSVRAVNKGVGSSDLMNGIIRRIRLACIQYGFSLWVRHIPGICNVESDALSRGALSRRIAGWSLSTASMDKWRKKMGGFTVDAYADVNGRNARAERWFSSTHRPGPGELAGESVWAFPPPSDAEEFWEEWTGWGDCDVVAVLPWSVCRSMPQGWQVWKVYAASARAFRRPVGTHWVRCSCSGVSMAVVAYHRSAMSRDGAEAAEGEEGEEAEEGDSAQASSSRF